MKIKNLILLVCVLFLSSCKKEVENLSCYPNSKRPNIAITYEEMAEMFDEYDDGAKKVLDKYMKKESKGKDSVSTISNWYRLEDLKQYIAYLEKISAEKGIKLTGIKIYPATYPKDYGIKKYRERQTLIFTPTTIIEGKEDVAFEPLYSKKGNPISITKFLEQVRNKKVNEASILPNPFYKTFEGLESSSANRASIQPPF